MKYSYKKKFDFERFGFKDPLFQIDKQLRYTANTPGGFYELTFVDPIKMYSVITYVGIDNDNYANWKDICEDDDYYYVLSDIIEMTKRKKIVPPTKNKPLIDHLADADYPTDRSPTVEVKEPKDSMRKFVMETIAQNTVEQDEKTESESLWEYA